jgi:hypothetical protein
MFQTGLPVLKQKTGRMTGFRRLTQLSITPQKDGAILWFRYGLDL